MLSTRFRSFEQGWLLQSGRRLGGPVLWSLAIAAGCLPGCFQERSFPMARGDYRQIAPSAASDRGEPPCETTREWLVRAAGELSPLLEPTHLRYMTTADMSDENGQPRNVAAFLDRPAGDLDSIVKNYFGFLHTAQSANQGWTDGDAPPAWPGFEQVWIPVADDLQLSGRLGFSCWPNGRRRQADCIVLLPGLFGDNGVTRTRDLAIALRHQGLHVLALELRGHGQTNRRYPNVFYTFGSVESQDLMRVSEWLEDRFPEVRRTGLIGFCWGGNLGILAAWFDGRQPGDPNITDSIAAHLAPISPRRHYTAGILAFSVLVRWEEAVDQTARPHDPWRDPVFHAFQQIIRDRSRMKQHPTMTHDLGKLIEYEYGRSEFTTAFPVMDAYRFIRLVPYRDRPCPPKLDRVRVPLLLVHAANDMFASPQGIADLLASNNNPNVAGLILRGGGHVGFFAYNRAYTYSLILNFFDPRRGPAACATSR